MEQAGTGILSFCESCLVFFHGECQQIVICIPTPTCVGGLVRGRDYLCLYAMLTLS